MKCLVSPLLLVLILLSFSLGWRATPPEGLLYPASMTLAGNRLFVSDRSTGLHVYDITNLAAPAKVIQIPLRYNGGSAVKGDIVYTNDYGQLQAIRITGDSYEVVARIGSSTTKYRGTKARWTTVTAARAIRVQRHPRTRPAADRHMRRSR